MKIQGLKSRSGRLTIPVPEAIQVLNKTGLAFFLLILGFFSGGLMESWELNLILVGPFQLRLFYTEFTAGIKTSLHGKIVRLSLTELALS